MSEKLETLFVDLCRVHNICPICIDRALTQYLDHLADKRRYLESAEERQGLDPKQQLQISQNLREAKKTWSNRQSWRKVFGELEAD